MSHRILYDIYTKNKRKEHNMIYAISDLHGCYDKYLKMLEKIRFSDDDTLYVLGDVIDRGEGGVEILLDMMMRENISFTIGNHEHSVLRMLDMLTRSQPDMLPEIYPNDYCIWMLNGGEPTVKAFCALTAEKKSEIIRYIGLSHIREITEVGGRKFHLSHTLPEYESDESIHSADYREFIFGEPDYDIKYADDMYFITGHTPTGLIDPAYTGRIYQKNNHIAIDCGAVFGNPLGCICLDTLEEFYAD